MEGRAKGAAFLVTLQVISLLHQPSLVSGDRLSPLLSPFLNGLCNAVYCGKGNCKASENHAFGFVCDCSPGWTQFHMEDHFRFLPCLIPNCSIDYSCSKTSAPTAPPPSPAPPDNFTLFNPCTWSFCGGGECVRKSTFEHRCECKPGYGNLLNKTSFPCYQDCSIGANCANLGISLSNSSSSSSSPNPSFSTPNVGDNGTSSGGDHSAAKNLLWLILLIVSFVDI